MSATTEGVLPQVEVVLPLRGRRQEPVDHLQIERQLLAEAVVGLEKHRCAVVARACVGRDLHRDPDGTRRAGREDDGGFLAQEVRLQMRRVAFGPGAAGLLGQEVVGQDVFDEAGAADRRKPMSVRGDELPDTATESRERVGAPDDQLRRAAFAAPSRDLRPLCGRLGEGRRAGIAAVDRPERGV